VQLLTKELYANARSVESELGGGDHGHLGMLMPENEYTAISTDNEEYEEPTKPAAIEFAATAVERERQKEAFRVEMEEYLAARRLKTQLRKQMIVAIPEIYIASLADETTGLANVHPRVILDHVIDEYGTIHPKDLEDNLTKLKSFQWNPDEPIQSVFSLGDKTRKFARDGNDPISDQAYTQILVNIFRRCGAMDNAVEAWELVKPTQRTLPNAIAHFIKYDKLRQMSKGYLKEILADRAAHTASSTQASTVSPLSTISAERAEATNTTLQGFFYCWSHGVCTHSGLRCFARLPGHIETATVTNRQGGSKELNLGKYDNDTHGGGRGGGGRGRGGRGRGRGRGRGSSGKRKAEGALQEQES
jgi:hypothetical protein